MNILAIIPARGNSKTVTKKSTALLDGKPLICYVVGTVVKSGVAERIVVATDDEEMARIARDAGAETPYLLSHDLTHDGAPIMPVLRDVSKRLEETDGYRPDYVLLVQPTSPFVRAAQLQEATQLLSAHPEADSLTSVVEVPHNLHPFNQRLIDENGYLRFVFPEERERYPTKQGKPKRYYFGNFFFFKPIVVKTSDIPIGKVCVPLVVDAASAFDVDGPEDFALAEAMLKSKMATIDMHD